MSRRAASRVRVRASVVAVAGLAITGLWLPSAASAAGKSWLGPASTGPQPAFYTYQAPGGSVTAGRRVIALTFDDGPGPYTPQVLSVLAHYGIPATFFEVGEQIAEYPQYTRLVAAAGDPVENHTWSHAELTTVPVSGFSYQIDQTQNEIRSVTGGTPACVRPPYDAWNSTVLEQDALRGLVTMSYSVDPRDWSLPGVQTIVNRVVSAAVPGAVVDLHDAGGLRDQTVAALPQIITDLKSEGYTFVSICGALPPAPPQLRYQSAVYRFGLAPPAGPPIVSNQPLVGMAVNPQTSGYWLVAADGGVFGFGSAPFYGSTGNVRLNQRVVGLAATSDGHGYWLVAADGGVFAFGSAHFYGSTGNVRLNQRVVGLAATSDGHGYWLVAADGGVFAFGSAHFYGSTGNVRLNQPVVGMAVNRGTSGYWLVTADGGIFTFHAPYYGSRGGDNGPDRFYAMGTTTTGNGYLLAGQHPA